MCSTATPENTARWYPTPRPRWYPSENTAGWYRQLLAAAIMQFPRPEKIGQQVAEGYLKNQSDLQQRLSSALVPIQTASTNEFKLVMDLGIVEVPADYVHAHLNRFVEKNRERFYYVNAGITDEYLGDRSGARLCPGMKIAVNLFKQAGGRKTSSIKQMEFLRQQPGNLWLGAQGVTLVWSKREELPKEFCYTSYDADPFWRDCNPLYQVSNLACRADGAFLFNLSDLSDDHRNNMCFLCFRDASA